MTNKNAKFAYEVHFSSASDFSYYEIIGASSEDEAESLAKIYGDKNFPGCKIFRIKKLGNLDDYIKPKMKL